MSYQKIALDRIHSVGILRLVDPATLNAMSVEMVEDIEAGLDELLVDARAIVLIGEGRAFCSGANLGGGPLPDSAPDYGASLETHANPLMLRLRSLSVPWVSAVRGPAAGIGCALALAADMVVASETGYFLQAFSRIGLVPDGGSSHMLVRTIGRARAMELMLLGERLSAATALDWGLVNRLVPDTELEASALALAKRLAEGPASLAQIRRLAWTALDTPFEEVLTLERREQATASLTVDCREGVTAFVEKRSARFVGR